MPQGLCHAFLFIHCSLSTVTGYSFCKIVATNESGCIKNGPTVIALVAIVIVYIQCGLRNQSAIVWKYFLVLKVFLQGDASSHDGCELDVVHDIRTGISCEVFFYCFFFLPIQPIPVTRPVIIAASRIDFPLPPFFLSLPTSL